MSDAYNKMLVWLGVAASVGTYSANDVGRVSSLPRRVTKVRAKRKYKTDNESPEALAKIAAAQEKRNRRNAKRVKQCSSE